MASIAAGTALALLAVLLVYGVATVWSRSWSTEAARVEYLAGVTTRAPKLGHSLDVLGGPSPEFQAGLLAFNAAKDPAQKVARADALVELGRTRLAAVPPSAADAHGLDFSMATAASRDLVADRDRLASAAAAWEDAASHGLGRVAVAVGLAPMP